MSNIPRYIRLLRMHSCLALSFPCYLFVDSYCFVVLLYIFLVFLHSVLRSFPLSVYLILFPLICGLHWHLKMLLSCFLLPYFHNRVLITMLLFPLQIPLEGCCLILLCTSCAQMGNSIFLICTAHDPSV